MKKIPTIEDLKPFDDRFYRDKLSAILEKSGISLPHLAKIIGLHPRTLMTFMSSLRAPMWDTKRAIRAFIFKYENQEKEEKA